MSLNFNLIILIASFSQNLNFKIQILAGNKLKICFSASFEISTTLVTIFTSPVVSPFPTFKTGIKPIFTTIKHSSWVAQIFSLTIYRLSIMIDEEKETFSWWCRNCCWSTGWSSWIFWKFQIFLKIITCTYTFLWFRKRLDFSQSIQALSQ